MGMSIIRVLRPDSPAGALLGRLIGSQLGSGMLKSQLWIVATGGEQGFVLTGLSEARVRGVWLLGRLLEQGTFEHRFSGGEGRWRLLGCV